MTGVSALLFHAVGSSVTNGEHGGMSYAGTMGGGMSVGPTGRDNISITVNATIIQCSDTLFKLLACHSDTVSSCRGLQGNVSVLAVVTE